MPTRSPARVGESQTECVEPGLLFTLPHSFPPRLRLRPGDRSDAQARWRRPRGRAGLLRIASLAVTRERAPSGDLAPRVSAGAGRGPRAVAACRLVRRRCGGPGLWSRRLCRGLPRGRSAPRPDPFEPCPRHARRPYGRRRARASGAAPGAGAHARRRGSPRCAARTPRSGSGAPHARRPRSSGCRGCDPGLLGRRRSASAPSPLMRCVPMRRAVPRRPWRRPRPRRHAVPPPRPAGRGRPCRARGSDRTSRRAAER